MKHKLIISLKKLITSGKRACQVLYSLTVRLILDRVTAHFRSTKMNKIAPSSCIKPTE